MYKDSPSNKPPRRIQPAPQHSHAVAVVSPPLPNEGVIATRRALPAVATWDGPWSFSLPSMSLPGRTMPGGPPDLSSVSMPPFNFPTAGHLMAAFDDPFKLALSEISPEDLNMSL